MAQAIQSLIATHGAWTGGGMAICGTAALEMGVRTIVDLGKIIKGGANDQVLKDLSADLGGTIFYGLCSVEVIPGAAIIGAAIFSAYSISSCENRDAYLTSMLLGKPVRWFGDNVFVPGMEKIVWPIIKVIAEIVGQIFNGIAEIMGNILKAIPLPENPIWIGVGAIGAAVVVIKVVLPALGLA